MRRLLTVAAIVGGMLALAVANMKHRRKERRHAATEDAEPGRSLTEMFEAIEAEIRKEQTSLLLACQRADPSRNGVQNETLDNLRSEP